MFFFIFFCFCSFTHSLHLKFDKDYSFACEVSNFNIIQDASEIRYLMKSTPIIIFKNQYKWHINTFIETLQLDQNNISLSLDKHSLSKSDYLCIHTSLCKKTLLISKKNQNEKHTKKINLDDNDILLSDLTKTSFYL